MSQKSVAITCVFFLALVAVSSAHAADFKGFYVGGNVGGVNGNSDASTTTIFSPTGYFAQSSVPAIATSGAQGLSANAFNGGGQAGYNFQHGVFVLGFETDFGSMSLSDSQTITTKYPCCNANFTITQSIDTGWLFTVRPRMGFAAGPLMVYGTGGLAMTHANYQELFTDTFASAHENGGSDDNMTGWTAGAGAEVKTGKRWSVKGEYLYANFGSMTVTSTNLTAPATSSWPMNVFTHTADVRGHIYRFGVNFHF